jgi:hypothetical protein
MQKVAAENEENGADSEQGELLEKMNQVQAHLAESGLACREQSRKFRARRRGGKKIKLGTL